MNSPVADKLPLERDELQPGLVVYRCSQTGGVFIPADSYWRWLRKHNAQLEQLAGTDEDPALRKVSPTDGEPKICPATGTVMLRFRVGHGLSFHVERSASGGIWLDGGEWEQLRAAEFHHRLHLIFGAPWQRDIRHDEQREGAEARLREHLGDEVFDRVSALKEELIDHPAQSEALAYMGRGNDEF